MLKNDTLKFLEALKENNTREWFTENKKWYDRARADYEQVIARVIHAVSSFDTSITNVDPKKSIFRIYRDVRFSTDKSPYKTHFGAVLRSHGMEKTSGYYFHLDPAGSFVSCGHYMLRPDQLKKIRRGIYNDFEHFQAIINEEGFKREFGDLFKDDDMLKRVPNGFDKDHPAAEYMKLKHFYVLKEIPEEILTSEKLVSHVSDLYELMQPLSEFLNDLLMDE